MGGFCSDPNLCANLGDCPTAEEHERRRVYVAEGQREGPPPSREDYALHSELKTPPKTRSD
jgi:hypothetical protein